MDLPIKSILAPLITLIIVQSIKLATDRIKGNFNMKNILTAYGGMPSSHTAVVISLTTIVGYTAGIKSPIFAVALIFSLIVITDALVLRGYIDHQGAAVANLIRRLPADEQKKFPYLYATKIKHTIPQVLIGAVIGFCISTIIHYL